MKIYHGSKNLIKAPIVNGSDPQNDYGPSFYLTLDLKAAKSWACKNSSVGIVNEYRLDEKAFKKLKILDLTNNDKYSVLNWMAILMHFRELTSSFKRDNKIILEWLEKFYIDVSDYDVVIGYRADDSYFKFPIRFISNDLAFDDLHDIFMSGNLGIQYAFISESAIKLLKFEKVIECEEKYLGHYYSIVTGASTAFNELLERPRDPNKKYILDLMREMDE